MKGSRIAKPSRSWVAKFHELPKGGKIAIVGGTVVLGGLLGYWAF